MRDERRVFKLSLLMLAMGFVSVNAQAADFGVPGDDNPLLPATSADTILTELSTGYSVPGDIFDISAAPNNAGFLNGVEYGPVAFGGVPGGATGWVNSSYVFPDGVALSNYMLAFWVSDVGDTSVDSALAIDNVQLPGGVSVTEFDVFPTGWTEYGSSDFSSAILGVSPTIGDTFGFIDTQNNNFVGGELGGGIGPGGVDTSVFGGTIGSVVLTDSFQAQAGDIVSFDANFLSNDGASFNDFAVVQLFDASSLFVTEPEPLAMPDSFPPWVLLEYVYDFLLFEDIIGDTEADAIALEDFFTSIADLEDSQLVLEAFLSEYEVSEAALTAYVQEFGEGGVVGEFVGGDGEEFVSASTTIEYDFGSAITLYTADSADPLEGLDVEIPLMPADLEPGDGVWVFPDVEVVPDVTWWFDPEYATGYDYEVSGGPAFASITLPAVGDDCYDLIVNGSVVHDCSTSDGLQAGVPHDLTDLGDITSLTVKGIEVDAQLDPADPNAFVTGFTFTDPGVVTVTQAPIVTDVPGANVPEPSTLFLLGAGALGFAGYRRKHKKA